MKLPTTQPPDKPSPKYNYELMARDNLYYLKDQRGIKLIKTQDTYDPVVSLYKQNYQLTHIILATIFSTVPKDETVDHVNQNPLDHAIPNLRWCSRSENSKVNSQHLTKQPFNIQIPDDEEWKRYETIEVSNYGRVRRPSGVITIGTQLRGKKYRSVVFKKLTGETIRFYMHQLVYKAFKGDYQNIILHDDSAPVHADGTYRNWLQDLRSGTHSENMYEFHSNNRVASNEESECIIHNPNMQSMEVTVRPRTSSITKHLVLPKGLWITKEPEQRCILEIKTFKIDGKYLVWKGTKSEKITLQGKIEQAKAYIRWALEHYSDLQAVYTPGIDLSYNPTGLTDLDVKFLDSATFGTSNNRKGLISKLPNDCGVTPDMLPKYSYYIPANDKRGDAFCYSPPPDAKGFKTTSSKSKTTKEKFDILISTIRELDATT